MKTGCAVPCRADGDVYVGHTWQITNRRQECSPPTSRSKTSLYTRSILKEKRGVLQHVRCFVLSYCTMSVLLLLEQKPPENTAVAALAYNNQPL